MATEAWIGAQSSANKGTIWDFDGTTPTLMMTSAEVACYTRIRARSKSAAVAVSGGSIGSTISFPGSIALFDGTSWVEKWNDNGFAHDLSIRDAIIRSDGKVWCAGGDTDHTPSGVWEYDPVADSMTQLYETTSMADAIDEFGDDFVVVGDQSGRLYKYESGVWSYWTDRGSRVERIIINALDDIYVAWSTVGVELWNGSSWSTIISKPGESAIDLKYVSSNDLYYLAYAGQRIYRYNEGSTSTIYTTGDDGQAIDVNGYGDVILGVTDQGHFRHDASGSMVNVTLAGATRTGGVLWKPAQGVDSAGAAITAVGFEFAKTGRMKKVGPSRRA